MLFPHILQALSHKTLVMLLGTDPTKNTDQPIPTVSPEVTFTYMKHMWRNNQKVGTEHNIGIIFFFCGNREFTLFGTLEFIIKIWGLGGQVV